MKYIVILGDGMAGEPLEALGGKTTLEAAVTPNMDALAAMGRIGLAKMVPQGMKPGSDVANLAVLGYDPRRCYSGRSPLEALSVGVALGCGVRGPPRPPDAPVTRQQAQQSPKPEDAAAGEAGVQDCEACDLRERALFD